MAKHYMTIVIPKNEATPDFDPRKNFHADFESAFDWAANFIHEDGHPRPELPRRETPTAFELQDVVVEIWICNAPTPYFKNSDQ